MASSSSSGLTFKLHPLVIVNISDHYTRVKSQNNHHLHHPNNATTTHPPRVYGCVIGVQRGRTVEIFNSFELLYDPSTHSLDRAFLEKKQELCNQSIPLPTLLSLLLWVNINNCWFFQIRRCSPTSTYWDGTPLAVMLRNLTCISTKL